MLWLSFSLQFVPHLFFGKYSNFCVLSCKVQLTIALCKSSYLGHSAGFCLWCNDLSSTIINTDPAMKRGCQNTRCVFVKAAGSLHLLTQRSLLQSPQCKIKSLVVLFLSANRNLFVSCQPFLVILPWYDDSSMRQYSGEWWESAALTLFYSCLQG